MSTVRLCPACGKEPLGPYRKLCDDCRDNHKREYLRRYHAKNKSERICPACGKEPLAPRRRICDICRDKKKQEKAPRPKQKKADTKPHKLHKAPKPSDSWIRITVPYPSDFNTSRRIIKSEVFSGMLFALVENSLVVYTRNNGVLAIPLAAVGEWAQELCDIARVWTDIVQYEERVKSREGSGES